MLLKGKSSSVILYQDYSSINADIRSKCPARLLLQLSGHKILRPGHGSAKEAAETQFEEPLASYTSGEQSDADSEFGRGEDRLI